MSNYSQQSYGAQTRPAFSALQSSSNASPSYNSAAASSIASRSSTGSAPPVSPSTSPQNQAYFGSLNQQSQQQQQPQQQQRLQAQRHPSFEYQPNRSGAGHTAAETTNYLNQAALLAEAAKRAQLACVMRDLDGMEL
ncbi:hypothetical protein COCSADRAFT_345790 [Bipolaris sorokiniana ND90Pr]|uniref:Uncharacterized protein n=3 Tax=Bipolaris TaxID=33194 RepID=M2SDC6_COCSN|nr:uncharacterized protein COCSADRAFT_345790 [Bipolaris sorokiniana ND90Pr]XP_007713599.1 uncharacterized protein COCCADRAFT_6143 [Bipolaris zeicola 26-R-13]XP_014554857.1 hypothetical protein COCVIDRAFT_103997 [Bipolaris victoriae FI3]EMD60495.1 hypothetical protein COCSADRAFT_345790 [Bipolaris sorokiniana ND90Pr]EUC32099.1 hypothetical protein COCCADRAFT_6143 [Bipolaris zeicola 26-R-13]